MPPSKFERFSNELTPAHLAMLARCIMDPNCAENLDEEGNKLVTPDAAVWEETLTHLEDANELMRRVTRLKRCTLGPAEFAMSWSAVMSTFSARNEASCTVMSTLLRLGEVTHTITRACLAQCEVKASAVEAEGRSPHQGWGTCKSLS